MIFMCNETGYLFELLIVALEDIGLTYNLSGTSAFAVGRFTLFGDGDPKSAKISEFADKFTFIGFV